jgi:hypothetical protein
VFVEEFSAGLEPDASLRLRGTAEGVAERPIAGVAKWNGFKDGRDDGPKNLLTWVVARCSVPGKALLIRTS